MSEYLECKMEAWDFHQIVNQIKDNLNGREIVLRWKAPEFEKQLYAQLQMKTVFYVTRDKRRVNGIDSFDDSEILGKSDQYVLVIGEDLRWSQAETDRYARGGYREGRDLFWLNTKPAVAESKGNQKFVYSDSYNNTLVSYSPCSVRFVGNDSHVKIGKNVVLPKGTLAFGNHCVFQVGDGSRMGSSSVTIATDGKLLIDNNVSASGTNFFVNQYSTIEIGEKTTIQTGKFRTGRNQKVIIGKDVMFSWDVVTLAHDGHLLYDLNQGRFTNNTNGEQRTSIQIGNHVWVGGETVFMPNTKIGDASICGYRSMPKGEYPNNCILVGEPARVVRKNVAWIRNNFVESDDKIELLDLSYRKPTDETKLQANLFGKSQSTLADQIAELQETLKQREVYSQQMESSFSWRITAPLRKIRYWQLSRKKN